MRVGENNRELCRNVGFRALSGAVMVSLGWVTVPAVALANPGPVVSAAIAPVAFFKKKKKKKKKRKKASKPSGLSPASAEAKRQAIRDSVAGDRESNKEAAATSLEDNAALLGDPVTMMEAGEVRLEIAAEERSIEQAEQSIEVTLVALDMLHFYDGVASGAAASTWLVIDPASASGLVTEAEAQISEAERLIEEIEAEEASPESEAVATAGEKSKAKKKRKKGKMKPGTGFIIGGSAATAVGAGGIGLAVAGLMMSRSAQNEVEDLGDDPANQARIDELDDEGARANLFAYVGIGVAAVGLAVGIPLIIVGAKKRKEAGPSASASLSVAPMVAGKTQGLTLFGRF